MGRLETKNGPENRGRGNFVRGSPLGSVRYFFFLAAAFFAGAFFAAFLVAFFIDRVSLTSDECAIDGSQ